MAKAKQLPSGAWRVQVYLGKKPDGTNDMESITRETEYEANRDAEILKEHHKLISRNPSNMTVGEAIDKYIQNREVLLSPATIYGYKKIRRNCLQGIMQTPLNRLTHEMIQLEINKEAKTKAPKYVRNAHGLLSAVTKEFMQGATLNTTLPKKQKFIPNIPCTNDVKIIIETVKDTKIELPVLMALWLGMRMSEIRAVKWKDVKNNLIHIRSAIVDAEKKSWFKGTKTYESARTILAPDYIMQLIGSQPQESEFIVTLSGQAIYKRFVRMMAKTDLPHFRFHDLRHANASVMLALNVPDKYAMERTGHHTTHMLKTVYQHTMSDEKILISNKIDSYFCSLINDSDSHGISHNA